MYFFKKVENCVHIRNTFTTEKSGVWVELFTQCCLASCVIWWEAQCGVLTCSDHTCSEGAHIARPALPGAASVNCLLDLE